MKSYLAIVHVIAASGLIITILLQKQGSGLGGILGGSAENYYTRRGITKSIFYLSIGLSVLFLGLGVANLVA